MLDALTAIAVFTIVGVTLFFALRARRRQRMWGQRVALARSRPEEERTDAERLLLRRDKVRRATSDRVEREWDEEARRSID